MGSRQNRASPVFTLEPVHHQLPEFTQTHVHRVRSGVHLTAAFGCYWASASTSPIPYKSSVMVWASAFTVQTEKLRPRENRGAPGSPHDWAARVGSPAWHSAQASAGAAVSLCSDCGFLSRKGHLVVAGVSDQGSEEEAGQVLRVAEVLTVGGWCAGGMLGRGGGRAVLSVSSH